MKKCLEMTETLLHASVHPRTPWYARAIAGLTVAYALSPIDLIPDFIPVIGLLDDLVLIPLGFAITVKLIPKDVMEECRAKAAASSTRPVRSRLPGILLVLAVWISLILLVLFSTGVL